MSGTAEAVISVTLYPAPRTAIGARRIFAHVGFRQDDRTRVAQPLDEDRILRWAIVRIGSVGATGSAHTKGVVLVLDRHRNTKQGIHSPGLMVGGVLRRSYFECVRHVGVVIDEV